jgi:predicted phosphohydrolase
MFDAIVYINLNFRTDRRESALREITKLSHITKNVHRIDAVFEKWCGHLGCGKSHVKALELAIENNWKSVLIVEDDVEFVGDMSNLDKIDKIKWDVMMLGYGHNSLNKCNYNFLRQVKSTTCAHAYIVRNHYYHILLDNFKNAVLLMTKELEVHKEKYQNNPTKLNYCSAIDQTWFSLQDKDTFYTFEPRIAMQRSEMGSDSNCSMNAHSKIIEEYYNE